MSLMIVTPCQNCLLFNNNKTLISNVIGVG
uniref:Uncharacterized protein n=1 Tax=Rhizophora mucronata TaxID=61149 RepID=A0A2P2PM60_RHIMU